MDYLIGVRATTDTPWEPRDAQGRHREFTAEELDALANFSWHWADLKGCLVACANVLLSRLPRNGGRREAGARSRTGTRGTAHAPGTNLGAAESSKPEEREVPLARGCKHLLSFLVKDGALIVRGMERPDSSRCLRREPARAVPGQRA
jgi:hypothetical protein